MPSVLHSRPHGPSSLCRSTWTKVEAEVEVEVVVVVVVVVQQQLVEVEVVQPERLQATLAGLRNLVLAMVFSMI